MNSLEGVVLIQSSQNCVKMFVWARFETGSCLVKNLVTRSNLGKKLVNTLIIIKSLFQEGNTISTKLISLAALKYLQFYKQI